MSAPALNDKWQKLQWHGQRWLQIFEQLIAKVGVSRWKMLLGVLLAAWVLANMARLVWLLIPAASDSGAPVSAPIINAIGAGAARSTQSSVDIEAMVAWHLFGEVGAQPRASSAAVEEQAQETTLNLQLLGLVSASDPSQSTAVIMADGTPQHLKVGEQLPGAGKIVLNKVLLDRVIIDNNGHYETLWLYDPAETARQPQRNGAEPVAAAAVEVDHRNNPQLTAMAQNYRQQLYQNPSSLADVVQVAPANENGKLVGYRIQPGRDARQFQQFGFKPGDIVTSINGVSLDDPQRALELYNLIRSAQEASFTVHRGNEDVTLMVSLQGANQEQASPQSSDGAQ